jgi:type III restriction enzyme
MALHPDFPGSPHAILDPRVRWFPADEALRETTMDKLMPPLVATLRRKVQDFRDSGYVGATETSRGTQLSPSLTPATPGYPRPSYDIIYADKERFRKYLPKTFRQLLDGLREYKRGSDEVAQTYQTSIRLLP